MVRTPAVCMSKCPWSRYWAPNCSQQLFHQCLSFKCARVFVTVNVGLRYRPRTLEKTRKRHTYAAHITLNPAGRSWYSSSKLKENLNEAAVAHRLDANNYRSCNRKAWENIKKQQAISSITTRGCAQSLYSGVQSFEIPSVVVKVWLKTPLHYFMGFKGPQ